MTLLRNQISIDPVKVSDFLQVDLSLFTGDLIYVDNDLQQALGFSPTDPVLASDELQATISGVQQKFIDSVKATDDFFAEGFPFVSRTTDTVAAQDLLFQRTYTNQQYAGDTGSWIVPGDIQRRIQSYDTTFFLDDPIYDTFIQTVNALAPEMDYLLEKAHALPTLVDLARTGGDYIQLLGSLLGYKWRVNGDAAIQQRLLSVLVTLYRIRGTLPSVLRVERSAGASVAGVFTPIEHAFFLDKSALSGSDRFLAAYYWTWGVYEIISDVDLSSVIDELDDVHPAGTLRFLRREVLLGLTSESQEVAQTYFNIFKAQAAPLLTFDLIFAQDEVTSSSVTGAKGVSVFDRVRAHDDLAYFAQPHMGAPQIGVQDTIRASDKISVSLLVTMQEQVTVGDFAQPFSGGAALATLLATDTVNAADELLNQLFTETEKIDIVNVTDKLQVSMLNRFTETVTIDDAHPSVFVDFVGNIKMREIDEPVNVTDTLNVGDLREIFNSVLAQDLLQTKAFQGAVFTDTVVISDSSAVFDRVGKSRTDTVNASDTLRVSAFPDVHIANTVNVTDILGASVFGHNQFAAADTINVRDQLSVSLLQRLVETVKVRDAITKQPSTSISRLDTIFVTDILHATPTRTIATADQVFATDTLVAIGGARGRVLSVDVVRATDKLIVGMGEVRRDIVRATDTLRVTGTARRTLTDTVVVSDTRTVKTPTTKALSDIVFATDLLASAFKVRNAIARPVDVVLVTDTFSALRKARKLPVDIVNVTDTLRNARVVTKPMSDLVSVSDTRTTLTKTLTRDVDAVRVTDTLATPRLVGAIRKLVGPDTVNATDTLRPNIAITKRLADTVNAADTLSARRVAFRAVSDVSTATDVVQKLDKVSVLRGAGRALQFDETKNQYVEVPDNNLLTPPGSFSIAAWFKWNGVQYASPKDNSAIVAKGNTAGCEYMLLMERSTLAPNQISFSVYINNGITPILTGVYTNTALFTAWHHIEVTYDITSGIVILYLDGSSISATLFGGTVINTTNVLRIGNLNDGTGNFAFGGAIDEVRIYNTANSAGTVNYHYQVGPYGALETNLIAGWHFDEMTGTTAFDYSGNGLNGTWINGPVVVSGNVVPPTLLLDGPKATDTFQILKSVLKRPADTVLATDVLQANRNPRLLLTEPVVVRDPVTPRIITQKSLSDFATITDVVSRTAKPRTALTDTVLATDTLAVKKTAVKLVSDPINITDVASRSTRQQQPVTVDNARVSDSIIVSSRPRTQPADLVRATDVLISGRKVVRADTAIITDFTATSSKTFGRNIQSTLTTVSDFAVARSRPVQPVISNIATVTDLANTRTLARNNTNNVVLATDVLVRGLNTGVLFDGATNYINVPQTASLQITQQLSVEGWFITPVATAARAMVMTWLDGTGTASWCLRTSSGGTTIEMDIPDNPAAAYTLASYAGPRGRTGPSFTSGNWHHVVAVFDGTQATNTTRLVIYIDGIAQTLSFFTTTIPATLIQALGTPTRMGGNVTFFPGSMDEVRIYNIALTAAQVSAHFNGFVGVYGQPEAGLVLGYHFDGQPGTAVGTVTDYSGSGNNGTGVNTPLYTKGTVPPR